MGARYLPKLQHYQDLQTSAQQIAFASVWIPMPIARFAGYPRLSGWPELVVARLTAKPARAGIYRQTGRYIERIRRNGILAKPDGDVVAANGR